jgi:hypothetical protein
VLIYENLPWMIAPIVSLPLVAKQLGYLYGRKALNSARLTTDSQAAPAVTAATSG